MFKKSLIETGRALILVGAIVMATASTAFAATQQAGGPGNGQGGPMMEGQAPNGQMGPQQGEAPDGEPPEKPEGDLAPEKPEGEAPDGEAPDGERPELPEGEEPNGERPEGPMDGQGMGGINIDALTEQIETVEDEDTLANLQELLTAYQDAIDAQKTALDEAEEGDDLSEYEEAVKSAWDALKSAMEDAGLEVSGEPEMLPGGIMDDQDGTEMTEPAPVEKLDNAAAPAEKADKTDDAAAETTETAAKSTGIKSVFNKIGNWFKNIFSKKS